LIVRVPLLLVSAAVAVAVFVCRDAWSHGEHWTAVILGALAAFVVLQSCAAEGV